MNTSTSHWYFSGFDARKACSWSPEEGLEEGEKYEFGRQPASTELSSKKTFCGGNVKLRALKLDRRNYSWGSEVVTRKTHVLEVFYNASYNKLDSSGCCTFQAVISSTLWSHNWSKEED